MAAILDVVSLRIKGTLGTKPRVGGIVCDDMARLLPGFREQVEAVCADMRSAGFNPRVFETWRSAERVAFLVQKGTGSPRSIHCLKAAVDIIDAEKLWKASAKFWTTLAEAYEARGLTAGARFKKRHDLPHGQAIPVGRQWFFTQLRGIDEAATDALRDEYAKQFYKIPRQP